jgi:hypothetical protein
MRSVRADALCATHYQQRLRGRPLTPIGERLVNAKAILPPLRLSRRCMDALEAAGPTTYRAAVTVLERWARRAGRGTP